MSITPDASLSAAYRAACYEIVGDNPAILRMADVPGAHDAWLTSNNANCAVVITAWNPFGQLISQTKNDAANRHLLKAIDSRSLRFAPALGKETGGLWRDDCYCVLDAPDALIEHWLVMYQQNAAIRVRKGGAPELVWHMRFGQA